MTKPTEHKHIGCFAFALKLLLTQHFVHTRAVSLSSTSLISFPRPSLFIRITCLNQSLALYPPIYMKAHFLLNSRKAVGEVRPMRL